MSIPKQSPLIFDKVDSSMPFNRKYAPKFVNRLVIPDKKEISSLRYIRRTSDVSCPPSWLSSNSKLKPLVCRIAKRFSRFCNGVQPIPSKSSFSSLRSCRLTSPNPLPFYFKFGRFTLLHLEFQTYSRDYEIMRNKLEPLQQELFKTMRNTKRCKPLKSLNFIFDEYKLNISACLMLKLQQHSVIFSYLQVFKLYYKCHTINGLRELAKILTNKKDFVQSHFSIEGTTVKKSNIDFQDFKNLTELSLNIENYCEDIFF